MFYEKYSDPEFKKLDLGVWNMFKFGWYLLKKNYIPLTVITVLMAIPSNLIAFLLIENNVIPTRDGIQGMKEIKQAYELSSVLFGTIGVLAGYYVIRSYLLGVKGVSIQQALFYGLRKWAIFILTSIFYVLSIAGGFILFIIPGIIISGWLTFYSYSIVFEEKSYLEALKYSKSLVSGRWWKVVGKSIGLNFFVGLLFGLPVFGIGLAIGWFTGDLQGNIFFSITSDTVLDVLSIPYAYISLGLFLAFQKNQIITTPSIIEN